MILGGVASDSYNRPPFWLKDKAEIATWEKEQSADRYKFTARAREQAQLMFESLTPKEQKLLYYRVYGKRTNKPWEKWEVDIEPVYEEARRYVRNDLNAPEIADDPPFLPEERRYVVSDKYELRAQTPYLRLILGEAV